MGSYVNEKWERKRGEAIKNNVDRADVRERGKMKKIQLIQGRKSEIGKEKRSCL